MPKSVQAGPGPCWLPVGPVVRHTKSVTGSACHFPHFTCFLPAPFLRRFKSVLFPSPRSALRDASPGELRQSCGHCPGCPTGQKPGCGGSMGVRPQLSPSCEPPPQLLPASPGAGGGHEATISWLSNAISAGAVNSPKAGRGVKGALKPGWKADWYNCLGQQFGRSSSSTASPMPARDSGHGIQGNTF